MTSVLFISEYFPPIVHGGGEINISLLAKALVKKGISVTVLTGRFSGQMREETVEGVRILRQLRTGRWPWSVLSNIIRSVFFERSVVTSVQKILKTTSFSVIHLIGASLGAAEKLKTTTSIPLVATVESYISLCPKGDFLCGDNVDLSRWSFGHFVHCLLSSAEIGKMKNRFYLKYNPLFWFFTYHRFLHLEQNLKLVHIASISSFVRGFLKKQYQIDSVVVPNFVDVSPLPVAKMRMGAKEKPIVAYLGSLAEHKGPCVLLEACEGLDCRVVLYGNGPLKKELLDFITDHHLDAQVFDSVPYSQVSVVYARAAIVVFPSLWPEPFGRIAIEAFSSGVPVVASRIGGIRETVPSEAGILVEPGHVGQLREALKTLLADERMRARMGRAGHAFVRAHYSTFFVVHRLCAFYEGLQ